MTSLQDWMAWHVGDTFLAETSPLKQWGVIERAIGDSEVAVRPIVDDEGDVVGWVLWAE